MSSIVVGMADLKACKAPDSLTTLGLGSCVGVCIYDRLTRISGMAHIMLPDSAGYGGQNRAKFADSAIADLVELMVRMGANRIMFTSKIAGGAHMFSGSSNDILKVGERNVRACIHTLEKLRVPIQGNDTGGTHGRTIELYSETGLLKIRTVGLGEKMI